MISGPAAQARLSFKKLREKSVTPKYKVRKAVTLSKTACSRSAKNVLRRISECPSPDSATTHSITHVSHSPVKINHPSLVKIPVSGESAGSYTSGSTSGVFSDANSAVLPSNSCTSTVMVPRSISPLISQTISTKEIRNEDTGNCSSSSSTVSVSEEAQSINFGEIELSFSPEKQEGISLISDTHISTSAAEIPQIQDTNASGSLRHDLGTDLLINEVTDDLELSPFKFDSSGGELVTLNIEDLGNLDIDMPAQTENSDLGISNDCSDLTMVSKCDAHSRGHHVYKQRSAGHTPDTCAAGPSAESRMVSGTGKHAGSFLGHVNKHQLFI